MPVNRNDFFKSYLQFTGGSEVPAFFNRWSAIAGLGAYLGRGCYIQFGNSRIHPNIYCMLIGNPGTRKSTAIKTFKKLLVSAGYSTIAASKTTKEKFMLDLSGVEAAETSTDLLDRNLFGDTNGIPAESFIMADEFNDFFGNNNLEFISLLGSLWDWEGPYENRIKNGKSFTIPDPTISILGGNTPTGFSLAFPTEILGQGFFSRLLLIYGEPNGRKIAFPQERSAQDFAAQVQKLQDIKRTCVGQISISVQARVLLDKIYGGWRSIPDVRFESYSNRRFTHLLKLCLIHAAAAMHTEIQEEDVICANTVLHFTETLMPKALGEFGKAKNSDVAHKIMQLLDNATEPLNVREIWKNVSTDLDKITHLTDLLMNLKQADKIQYVETGWLPKKIVQEDIVNGVVDFTYLTEEERKI